MSRVEVAAVLIDIEAELRRLDLWQQRTPPAAAFESHQPFCFDTLTLPQWLQFVFLPTLYDMLEQERPLPSECGVAPMAEEYFRGARLHTQPLIDALRTVDRLLTGGGL